MARQARCGPRRRGGDSPVENRSGARILVLLVPKLFNLVSWLVVSCRVVAFVRLHVRGTDGVMGRRGKEFSLEVGMAQFRWSWLWMLSMMSGFARDL